MSTWMTAFSTIMVDHSTWTSFFAQESNPPHVTVARILCHGLSEMEARNFKNKLSNAEHRWRNLARLIRGKLKKGSSTFEKYLRSIMTAEMIAKNTTRPPEQLLESTLSQRGANLEKEVHDAAEEAKWVKKAAETEQKKLRERALKAQRVATHGTIPIEAYREQLNQVHELELALTNDEKEKADVKREGETVLEEVRHRLTKLESIIQSLRDNRRAKHTQ